MSRQIIHTYTCPCGEVFSSTTYNYVNVAKDPQLRYIVLAGLLNVSICPVCGRRAAVAHPFIYSDPTYNLLAYVHPRNDAPEEARLLILEKLRSAYTNIVTDREEQHQQPQEQPNGNGHHHNNSSKGQANGNSKHQEDASVPQELPPLQVIFGIEQLQAVINAVLPPEERLGRLAMSTKNREEAARGQFLDITRKLATEMGCSIEVEDLPDEYTVWLYGSRRQIGALMRELPSGG